MARIKLSRAKAPDPDGVRTAARGRWREAAEKAFWVAVVVALLAGYALLFRQAHGPSGVHRPEYEGRIVDKHLTGGESQEGSYVVRRLLIEGRDGVRFEVGVGPELYERAQIGMWIKNGKGQVELTWPEPQPPAAERAK